MDNYFIDAHCHLHLPWFSSDILPSLLDEAKLNSVEKVISCASNPENYDQVLEDANNMTLFATIGLQPTFADKFTNADIIRPLLDANLVPAIGEVGLDYYWIKDESLRDRQLILFESCIQLANEYQLPLVIHSRKAEQQCLEVLENLATTPILLHSFEGNLELVNRAIDSGYLISIPTNVTRRRNRRKVATRAGLDNILLESDSPFCAPSEDIHPNTPKSITQAAEKLSEVFECSIDEIASTTTKNTEEFYQI